MTKADKLLVQDIHNILDNGYKDVNPRPRYEDGTPAYTISVNHVVRNTTLVKANFPSARCDARPGRQGSERYSPSTSTRQMFSPR